jgi:hypothetical protein
LNNCCRTNARECTFWFDITCSRSSSSNRTLAVDDSGRGRRVDLEAGTWFRFVMKVNDMNRSSQAYKSDTCRIRWTEGNNSALIKTQTKKMKSQFGGGETGGNMRSADGVANSHRCNETPEC